MKLFDCLPVCLSEILQGISKILEIRIRNGRPVRVNVDGQWYFVSEYGLTQNSGKAIVVGDECNEIVRKACNNSVYAYEKMLAKGFFTLEDGVRVGVCGHVAGSKEAIFQKYTSLCFRVPHHVNLVDSYVLSRCSRGSVVVIGPPCSGKTTFLRDLSVKLSHMSNVLVVDERGELFYDEKLIKQSNCDVLKWTSKEYAFEIGIRAMSPQWIVCDELSVEDITHVRSCINSGVHIACSAHGSNYQDFVSRFGLESSFQTAVILRNALGKIEMIDVKSLYNNEKSKNI